MAGGRRTRGTLAPLVVAAALVCAGQPAFGDARTDAKRHFKNGMALVAAGDTVAGIAELERAYALKPHPAVLYNIGRALETQGEYARAADAYRRYLQSAPPDAPVVEARAQRLEMLAAAAAAQAAQQVVSPPPPPTPAPAPVAAPDPGAPVDLVIPPPPPDATPQTLRAAAALARGLANALEQQAQPTSNASDVDAGPAIAPPPPLVVDGGTQPTAPGAVVVSPPADHPPPSPALTDPATNADEIFAETSITASRTLSDVLDAPAFVTVITREDIQQSGARTIPDLLRRVPGVAVAAMTQSDFNVAIRGLNRRLSNKVLVLVDGRTVYQDFLGGTLWEALPVNLEDIERVEVVRGPGAALYGASAFGGVVNIITVGVDRSTLEATVEGGLPRQGRLTLRVGGVLGLPELPKGALRGTPDVVTWMASRVWKGPRLRGVASGGLREVAREELATTRPDLMRPGADPDVSGRSARGNAMVELAGSGSHSVRVEGGAVRLRQDLNALGSLRNYVLDGTFVYGSARYALGPFSVRTFYNGLDVEASPELTARRPDPLKTRVRTHLVDVEPLLSVPFNLLGQHHVVAGGAWRFKTVDWSYLGPPQHQNLFSVFAQETWRPLPLLTLTGSYRVDRHPLAPPHHWDVPFYGRLPLPPLPGLSHAARAAATLKVFNTALRVAAGTAFRDPTFLESYVDLKVPLPVEGAALRFVGGRLFPERIASAEVGFSTRASDRFSLDGTAYVMAVDRLIGLGDPKAVDRPAVGSDGRYVVATGGFANAPTVLVGGGAELLARFFPMDGLDVDLGWAGHRLWETGAPNPWGLITGAQALPRVGDFRARQEDPPYRFIAGVRVRAPFGLEAGLEGALTGPTSWREETVDTTSPTGVRFVDVGVDPYVNTQARVAWRILDGAVVVSAVGQNLLAPPHREHPLGDRLGPRGLVTLTLRP